MLQLEVEGSRQIQGYLNIIIEMAHSTGLFKYTVIESPINQVSTQRLLRSLQGNAHGQSRQRSDLLEVRRKLEMSSKQQEGKQQSFLQDRQQIYKQEAKFINGEGQVPQDNAKLLKNKKFNSILQQIGQFKKSIYQIRERLQKNIIDAKPQAKYLTQKKSAQNHKYDLLHQNYSYTNYRDLSNRGKPNRSYDRWKSHERSYTFLKDSTPIQQFTIEVPDQK